MAIVLLVAVAERTVCFKINLFISNIKPHCFNEHPRTDRVYNFAPFNNKYMILNIIYGFGSVKMHPGFGGNIQAMA